MALGAPFLAVLVAHANALDAGDASAVLRSCVSHAAAPVRCLEKLEDTITGVAALTFVSFLLKGSLKLESRKAHGKEIIVISISSVWVVVLGFALLRLDFGLALVLASIAAATAPAASLDMVRQ